MRPLLGVDFDELAAEGSGHFENLAVRVLDVAEVFALLVLLADVRLDGLDALAVATDFPKHGAALAGHDGVGLGVLQGEGLVGRHTLGSRLVLRSLEVGEETFLGDAALVVAVLLLVHGELEELLFVLTFVPAVFGHLLAEAVEVVGIVFLRVGVGEFVTLRFGQLDELGIDGAGQTAALTENHAPHIVVHHGEAGLALGQREQVHERNVLDVLAERRDQGGIAHLRPDVGHLVKEADEEFVLAVGLFALALANHVDARHDAFQVGHHRAHHAARQSAAQQQGTHQLVARIHEVAQEVVDKLLCQRAGLHVGVHVDFGHVEAIVFQHALHRDDVGVALAPRKGLDGGIDDVAAVLADLQNGSHDETGTVVAVILHDDVGVLALNHAAELAEEGRLTDARHVLQADFGRAGLDELVGDGAVVLGRVDGRVGDAEGGLRRHAGFEGVVNRRDDVAHVVESAEDTGNVDALGVLHLVLQATHVGRAGEHAQRVQSAVEHVGLYAHFVKGFGESAYGLVRILAVEKVDLLKGAAVGLYARETAHPDDDGRDAFQLILTGLEFSRGLEHVAVDQTELDFPFHKYFFLLRLIFAQFLLNRAKVRIYSHPTAIAPAVVAPEKGKRLKTDRDILQHVSTKLWPLPIILSD